MQFLILFLAAIIAIAYAAPLPKPPIDLPRDVAEAFISDNEIDGGSGVFNVILVQQQRPSDREELVDPDLDELADIENLHSGRRGWGYSARREGVYPKL